MLLAGVAAGIAWWFAHDVLGHAQPFFAPIAAAISLSTSEIQRSRRIVQMVAGVLLGIGIGELLSAALGTSTVAVGLIAFVTLSAALLSGEGVFGEGMMFANQAAASAILVVALHHHGTGSERALDALVGGAVALIFGVLLFPAQPIVILRRAEEAVLRTLVDVLEELTGLLRTRHAPQDGWALENGHRVHALLATMARARATAHANVRVAPRRWHLRPIVDAEIERTARLDLLANAELSLIRAVTTTEQRGEHVSEAIEHCIVTLAGGMTRLLGAPRPLPPETAEEVRAQARQVADEGATRAADESPVVAAIVRAMATDLIDVVSPSVPADTDPGVPVPQA